MIKNINFDFDDYLNLLSYDFSKYKYIIFKGNSGSGKSSYIKEILEKNKSLEKKIIYIDEIFNFFDLFKIIKLLINNKKKFIIASHISFKYFFFLKLFGKIKKIETDKNSEKIYNYLKSKNMTFSKQKVKEFIKLFGATYTDIDIILEKYNGNDFNKAYNFFIRNSKIELNTINQDIKIKNLK